MRSFVGFVAFGMLIVLVFFPTIFSGSSDKKANQKTRISIGKIFKETGR